MQLQNRSFWHKLDLPVIAHDSIVIYQKVAYSADLVEWISVLSLVVRSCKPVNEVSVQDQGHSELDWLAGRFEENWPRLQAVAYRMFGSTGEAEDAVREAWLRLSRADADDVENLAGFLTTITARVCPNMLQARRSRPEEPAGTHPPEPAAAHRDGHNPEDQILNRRRSG